jgi:hypothetical protein
VPTAASSIAARPDVHIGQMVSMACVAEAALSKTVFTVDQGAAATAGAEVLVIAPALNAAVVRYQGRPAVFATSVVTADLVDIGKRLPPPLTPAEVALREAMVAINANNGALRKGLEMPDPAAVQKQIAELKNAFTAADRFFTERKAEDALGWAGEALGFLAAMETGAAAGRWEDVRGAATSLNGLCSRCHTARRIRLEDGSFRFRGE